MKFSTLALVLSALSTTSNGAPASDWPSQCAIEVGVCLMGFVNSYNTTGEAARNKCTCQVLAVHSECANHGYTCKNGTFAKQPSKRSMASAQIAAKSPASTGHGVGAIANLDLYEACYYDYIKGLFIMDACGLMFQKIANEYEDKWDIRKGQRQRIWEAEHLAHDHGLLVGEAKKQAGKEQAAADQEEAKKNWKQGSKQDEGKHLEEVQREKEDIHNKFQQKTEMKAESGDKGETSQQQPQGHEQVQQGAPPSSPQGSAAQNNPDNFVPGPPHRTEEERQKQDGRKEDGQKQDRGKQNGQKQNHQDDNMPGPQHNSGKEHQEQDIQKQNEKDNFKPGPAHNTEGESQKQNQQDNNIQGPQHSTEQRPQDAAHPGSEQKVTPPGPSQENVQQGGAQQGGAQQGGPPQNSHPHGPPHGPPHGGHGGPPQGSQIQQG